MKANFGFLLSLDSVLCWIVRNLRECVEIVLLVLERKTAVSVISARLVQFMVNMLMVSAVQLNLSIPCCMKYVIHRCISLLLSFLFFHS